MVLNAGIVSSEGYLGLVLVEESVEEAGVGVEAAIVPGGRTGSFLHLEFKLKDLLRKKLMT